MSRLEIFLLMWLSGFTEAQVSCVLGTNSSKYHLVIQIFESIKVLFP
jgi:hypothetical protein